MADVAYDAVFGAGFSFTFTPSTGTPFGSAQAQVEEADTPAVTIDSAKYTPISGPNSNIEQEAQGRYPVQDYKVKVTYSKAEHIAALACQANRKKGVLVCTYGDGLVETYTNAWVKIVSAGTATAANLRTAEITFSVPVPPATA